MISDLLFPEVKNNIEFYEKKYPYRTTKGKITRFAPSPTGFLHIGGLYSALISKIVAKQSNGIFYLRIEDTDKEREVKNGIDLIISLLKEYGIDYDNDPKYGPYKQSERKDIYLTFIKYLIDNRYAYPCFCKEEELEELRNKQEKLGIKPGYYGEWTKCRDLSEEEIKKKLKNKEKFVIRIKANPETVILNDLIKGKIEFPGNDVDMILIKSDKYSTYHFAHVVDDHLMRTNLVIRGDEWVNSIPLHFQLFKSFGWKVPDYAHLAPIQKMDGESRRKLSKRKDPEASMEYYQKEGYPVESVIDYLLNLANSEFENWRKMNSREDYMKFKLKLNKMSTSGPLFDEKKFIDVSKNVIGFMKVEKVYELLFEWSKNDKELMELLKKHKDYTIKILNIEKNLKNPRKDFAKWSEYKEINGYLYDELFYKEKRKINKEIINAYKKVFSIKDNKNKWFNKIRELAGKFKYAKSMEEYNSNPKKFKGSIIDFSQEIRIAITNREKTPDLYEIIQAMGEKMVKERLNI